MFWMTNTNYLPVFPLSGYPVLLVSYCIVISSTKVNTKAGSRIIVYIAISGYVRIIIDSMIEIAPKPICTYRRQLGDFCLLRPVGDFTSDVIYLILE